MIWSLVIGFFDFFFWFFFFRMRARWECIVERTKCLWDFSLVFSVHPSCASLMNHLLAFILLLIQCSNVSKYLSTFTWLGKCRESGDCLLTRMRIVSLATVTLEMSSHPNIILCCQFWSFSCFRRNFEMPKANRKWWVNREILIKEV